MATARPLSRAADFKLMHYRLAPGARPDQDMTVLRPRSLELIVLDQHPDELPFHLDQAIGADDGIGRGRGDTHGVAEYRFTA